MDTKRLREALEIIARHKPEGASMSAEHDEIFVCGKLPFTKDERAALKALGFTYDRGNESWSCFT